MRRLLWLVVLFLPVVAGLRAPSAVQAQTASPVTIAVRAGFDNLAPSDGWYPIWVTLTNDGPAVDGRVEVTTGGSDTSRFSQAIALPTQSRKEIVLYATTAVSSSSLLQATLRDQNGRLVAQTAPTPRPRSVPQPDLFWAVVSNETVPLDLLTTVRGSRPGAALARLAPADLPTLGPALDGLDVIALTHLDSGRLSSAQIAALRAWVEVGGALVVLGGVQAQQTAAAFLDWLPVTPGATQTAGGALGLGWQGEPVLYTANSLRPGAEVLLGDVGHNILTRRALGRGAVFYLALDAQLEPLRDPDVGRAVWQQVALAVGRPAAWDQPLGSDYGINLAAQTFPQLRLPSVLALLGFLSVYIALIGPVNYWVLKRRGRREWAWVTIPIIIAVFLVVAYFTGFQVRGNQFLVNRLTAAVGSAEGDLVREQTAIGFYSPQRAELAVRFADGALPYRFAADEYGGAARVASQIAWDGSAAVLEDLRFSVADVAGARTLAYRPKPPIRAFARLQQDGPTPQLVVEIANGAAARLENACLFLGAQVLVFGDVEPGQRLERTFNLTAAADRGALLMLLDAVEPQVALDLSGVDEWTLRNQLVVGDAGYIDYQDYEQNMRRNFLDGVWPYSYDPATRVYWPAGRIVLTGWMRDADVGLSVGNRPIDARATTFYLLELPVER